MSIGTNYRCRSFQAQRKLGNRSIKLIDLAPFYHTGFRRIQYADGDGLSQCMPHLRNVSEKLIILPILNGIYGINVRLVRGR